MYKGKRVLKNGAIGAFVKYNDGKWRWRIIGRLKTNKKIKGGNKNNKTLVLFYTNWCGYCQMFKPHYNKLKKIYKGSVKILDIDCDKNKRIVNKHNIEGYPTVRLYLNGINDHKNFKDFNKERSIKGLISFLKEN